MKNRIGDFTVEEWVWEEARGGMGRRGGWCLGLLAILGGNGIWGRSWRIEIFGGILKEAWG